MQITADGSAGGHNEYLINYNGGSIVTELPKGFYVDPNHLGVGQNGLDITNGKETIDLGVGDFSGMHTGGNVLSQDNVNAINSQLHAQQFDILKDSHLDDTYDIDPITGQPIVSGGNKGGGLHIPTGWVHSTWLHDVRDGAIVAGSIAGGLFVVSRGGRFAMNHWPRRDGTRLDDDDAPDHGDDGSGAHRRPAPARPAPRVRRPRRRIHISRPGWTTPPAVGRSRRRVVRDYLGLTEREDRGDHYEEYDDYGRADPADTADTADGADTGTGGYGGPTVLPPPPPIPYHRRTGWPDAGYGSRGPGRLDPRPSGYVDPLDDYPDPDPYTPLGGGATYGDGRTSAGYDTIAPLDVADGADLSGDGASDTEVGWPAPAFGGAGRVGAPVSPHGVDDLPEPPLRTDSTEADGSGAEYAVPVEEAGSGTRVIFDPPVRTADADETYDDDGADAGAGSTVVGERRSFLNDSDATREEE